MPNTILHLPVTGRSPRSLHAVARLRRICDSRPVPETAIGARGPAQGPVLQ